MFCPVCKIEYIEGVYTCDDCNVKLVRTRPPEDEPASGFVEYEEILTTYNAMDIALLKSILDAERIIYYFQGEHFSYVKPMAIPVRLMVKKEQVSRAKDILTDIKLSFVVGSNPEMFEDEGSD